MCVWHHSYTYQQFLLSVHVISTQLNERCLFFRYFFSRLCVCALWIASGILSRRDSRGRSSCVCFTNNPHHCRSAHSHRCVNTTMYVMWYTCTRDVSLRTYAIYVVETNQPVKLFRMWRRCVSSTCPPRSLARLLLDSDRERKREKKREGGRGERNLRLRKRSRVIRIFWARVHHRREGITVGCHKTDASAILAINKILFVELRAQKPESKRGAKSEPMRMPFIRGDSIDRTWDI